MKRQRTGVDVLSLSGLIATLAVFLAGCVSEPSAITGEKRSYGYSWQQEVALGAEADGDIVAEMGIYEDPGIQDYVDQVAKDVLTRSDFSDPDAPELYRDVNFTFRVLDTSVVNAFALPGGYVYVTRGLLAHMNNEAQLAVVLGHEIGHVVARHSSRQALRAQLGQLGLVAGAIIGDQVAPESSIGSQILDLGGSAFQLLLFRYSRDAEREADALWIKYSGLAGYEPAQSADFFESLERMSASAGRVLPAWQSTHPDPGERAKTVREAAGAWIPVGQTNPEVGTDELLNHLEGIVVGEDPRQGFRDGDTFYHPGLQFQFPIPPGWKLQNERAVVLMTPADGSALIGLQMVPGSDVEAAAAQAVAESGLQVIDSRTVTIHGLPARILLGDLSNGREIVRTFAAFIGYEGNVFNFVGQSAPGSFSQAQPTFERTATGFAPLEDADRLDVQPGRLEIRTTDHSAPFRELLPKQLPSGWTPETVAILNQLELDEAVPKGRRLKLPR
jgi:predicted Zn-dependent protease